MTKRYLRWVGSVLLAGVWLESGVAPGAEDFSSSSSSSSTAAATMPARIHVDIREAEGRRVEGSVRGHRLAVDQPKEFGAADTAPTPPETLAFALGACMVSTLRYMAILDQLDLRNITATVDGALDYARASGQPTAARAGYAALRITIAWDTSLDADAQQRLARRARERCPMCDNLANPTPFDLVVAPRSPTP